jgi:ABC-type nitrate/sulfonate/bicarbonate transport system substrate-binding protein
MSKQSKKEGMSRRDFIKATGSVLGGGALMAMIPNDFRTGAWAAGTDGLEKTKLTFGIIPLTDCAPIVIAAEKGFFKKYGLDVTVSKEASWANIRDKVSIGALDGAHMLAGMPIAASLGVGALQKPTITAFSMDLNGNGITVSNDLYKRMWDADPEAMKESPTSARALKKVIDEDKKAGKDPMTFAMVFPVSTHNYEIRYWMASAGIDPDKDVRLIVIPPPQMVANLRAKNIVGYCVGEPWNEPAVMALIEAAQWMDKPENRMEVVKIISRKSYVNAPVDVVKMSMTGTFKYAKKEDPRPLPDFNVFYRYAATFPWYSHATWFISQMYRWGQIEKPMDIKKAAESIYRPDIYRQAASELGMACPTIDYKKEGFHKEPWTLTDATSPIEMGSDAFFDGMTFDPGKLVDYIKGFKVANMSVSLEELAKLNA